MESIKTILEEMADQENDGKDTTGGELRVGIDGHLFTKTAIDQLLKTKGIDLAINREEKPVVEELMLSDNTEN